MKLRRPWLPSRALRAAGAAVLAPWALLIGLAVIAPDGGGQPLSAHAATPEAHGQVVEPAEHKQRLEILTQLGVDRWHAAGFRGKGIKVAILDSGFRGYKAHLGKALPARVITRSFRSDGNLEAKDSQHGILCSEILHALAPEAEIILANWDTDSPERFLEAARWARKQGARVISCSIIMPSWSDGDGGGHVNRTLASIVGTGEGNGDLLCFASAGNTAQRHWCGRFHDAGTGFHEWKPGKTRNGVHPWGSERVSVELYWTGGDDDYEIKVTDERGEPVGHASAHHGHDRCCTMVHFNPVDWKKYQVQVKRTRGKGTRFHLVVLGGGLEHAEARGSIACPADGPGALAVGAVHADGCRAAYSSCGPNSAQPKPDFMATVPFPSLWRSKPFTGTSAAAPQAAALAALCWCRHPDWTAAQVREALKTAARDLGPPGHDAETGYGLICLPSDGK
jgi:subtilisin family serine protease